MRHRPTISVAAAVALTLAAPAGAKAATTAVEAAGNAFTGGLKFAPADVTVKLGDEVAWTNTDFVAPHTATENHGLWNLTGTYGATPLNPPGFGPGVVMRRSFEAGVHRYYCIVHPQPMRGTITVAPDASVERSRRRVKVKRRGRRKPRTRIVTSYRVSGVWATAAAADGLAFDVDRRPAGGDWARWLTATRDPRGSFAAKKGANWEIRARLRKADREELATDWSPAASVTAR